MTTEFGEQMEKTIYFDHAATSWPKPASVSSTMKKAMYENGGNPGRSGHILSVKASKAIYKCREAVSDLFSFDEPERVIFTQNTTYALNTAIKGIVKRGDHVVISNLEHNSVLRPVERLSQEKGITYSTFDATDESDDDVLYCLKRAIKQNTKTVVVTAASNVCGKILPISQISSECHRRGITLIVDGAQAGGVFPINFKTLGADILCLAGHKGLYGPQGTGIMLCCKNITPESLAEGGNGINSQDKTMGDILPEKLEAGTPNTPGICGLYEGIKYVSGETVEEIFGRTLHLTRFATEALLENKNITVYGDYGVKAPVISFNLNGFDPSYVSSRLSDNGICTRSGLHCAPLAHTALGTNGGTVRISFGHKNTKNEIEKFLKVINKIR